MKKTKNARTVSPLKVAGPQMTSSRLRLTEDEIDERVIAQVDDDSAWESAVHVSRKQASVALSASLAQRAAFLARLHRERNLQSWVERVIRERVELEERALTQARRELRSRAGGR
jgi:hypothetical protein